jgi:AraC family transcriptional regulator
MAAGDPRVSGVPSARRVYDRYIDFYGDAYPDVAVRVRKVGRIGATLMEMSQGAGDWSDAPVRELWLGSLASRPVRGAIDVGAGRIVATFPRDSIIMTPPCTATSIVIEGDHSLRSIGVPWKAFLDFAGLDRGLPADGSFGALHASFTTDRGLVAVRDALWRAAWASSTNLLEEDGLLLQLIGRLAHLAAAPVAPARGGLAPWAERRCCEYLRAHFAEDVSLDALAALAGLSPFHFARMFKVATGLPPHAYQRRCRAEKAQVLLRQTDLPITEIAFAVGYETPQAFARMFRAEIGASPSDWRRKARA